MDRSHGGQRHPDGKAVFNPAIAVSPDGQASHHSFHDKRHDTGSGYLYDLYLAESFDAGLTWEPNHHVSTETSDLHLAPLTSQGRMVGITWYCARPGLCGARMAVWVDTRTGSPDPFVATVQRSRGSSFATWQRLAFRRTNPAHDPMTARDADPDFDGVPNLVEYALGMDPLRPDSAVLGTGGVVTAENGVMFTVDLMQPSVRALHL